MSTDKLKHLDGLRGFASFIVILHHYACAFLPAIVFGTQAQQHYAAESLFYSTPLSIFFNGNFAVCVFFALSGFVLTHRFFLQQDNAILLSGAVKRYFRLMPPAAISILIAYLVLKTGHFYNLPLVQATHSSMWLADLWNFPANFGVAIREALYGVFTSNDHTYNTNLWTMKYEFLGSFMVFGLASLFAKMQRRYLLYLVLTVVFIKSYYLGFILGMAVADFRVQFLSNEAFKKSAARIAPFLMLFALYVGSYPLRNTSGTIFASLSLIPGLTHDELFVFWHNFGAVLLMAGFLYSSGAKRVFSNIAFTKLGKHSFSLYLVHLIVIGSFSSYLFLALLRSNSYGLSLMIMSLTSLILIFALSWFYTNWVDSPFTLLANRIAKRILAPKSLALTRQAEVATSAQRAANSSLVPTPGNSQ